MKDELGDRMKQNYENRTRYYLPRRTYTMIRLDGKSFHSYTKGCDRPFDNRLMWTMDMTAKALCEQIQGAKIAFVQSDEISILLTDFEDNQTEAWFDGNIQKICSISASVATAAFNKYAVNKMETYSNGLSGGVVWYNDTLANKPPAMFDSRVFTIPDRKEVCNYFIWRQKDSTRNSVSMAAQAEFPHKELQRKSSDQMQEMLFQERGINWNDYPVGFKRGRCVVPVKIFDDVTYIDKRTGEEKKVENVERSVWRTVDPPVFTQNWDWMEQYIPEYK